MPTYQYACTACGNQLEVVQKFADEPLTECPSCHGRLRKLFSAVGIVFKGSGFYRTDSRSTSSSSSSDTSDTKPADGAAAPAKPDAGAGSGEAAGGVKKAESKPSGGDSSKVA